MSEGYAIVVVYNTKKAFIGLAKSDAHAAQKYEIELTETAVHIRDGNQGTIKSTYEVTSNNAGKSCWGGCSSTQGLCQWCGDGGMCCKVGWIGNGCDGTFGISGMGHVCVADTELTVLKASGFVRLKVAWSNNLVSVYKGSKKLVSANIAGAEIRRLVVSTSSAGTGQFKIQLYNNLDGHHSDADERLAL